MKLSWNEIRNRAYAFVQDWQDESREHAEAKTFWDEFFQVFGMRRRNLATFEEPVKTLKKTYGFIDLFWKGTLLAEHKSRGKSLEKAQAQAMDYVQDLIREGRDAEVPRYVALSDFARIALHDLDEDRSVEFPLRELPDRVEEFAFIPGYKQHVFQDQAPINVKAAEILGNLHDALEASGFTGQELERLLVRILFCLFAEDSGIFERDSFRYYLENRTGEDGSDLGMHLLRLFEVLNTPEDKRQSNLDELLTEFPYVNGDLFAQRLGFAEFNRTMREALLACTLFDWSQISPAIFGSLFQSVMEPKERREIGGHYTSERDILKVIKPLFLDQLREEFEKVKHNKQELRQFHQRLAKLKFFDPACGCGNFLVITYRELRLLELDVLKVLHPQKDRQRILDISTWSIVNVDSFYGIELQEWPARIAEVALWLMDHQMNQKLSNEFGQYFRRLPLKATPVIVQGNALRMKWEKVLPPKKCGYVLGNPPFIGGKYQNAEQKADVLQVAGNVKGFGLLDYVAGWYFKAADYVQGTRIKVGFVSTNSISQGEQVGILWNELFRRYRMTIHFAHRTFTWESDARGRAHVHVVIIGFAHFDAPGKRVFDYELSASAATEIKVSNISPYLLEGGNTVILNRSKPMCKVPEVGKGNQPIDDGNYLFTPEEKTEFLRKEPEAKKYFRRWLGSKEFINGIERWCLWIENCPPHELRTMPFVLERIEKVREFRLASKRKVTRELAAMPTRFAFRNVSDFPYLLIPEVSSERRKYVPMGYVQPEVLASNLVSIIPNASLFLFGVLTSAMQMAWVRHVAGRLKSDYRYSNKLVYNNFPWPQGVDEKRKAAVEAAAQTVLNVRANYPEATMADLYDPRTMPADLMKAHANLDRAVDRCYRSQPFPHDRNRMEFLFGLYEELR